MGCNNSCLDWKHSLDIKWCLYYPTGNCAFWFLHLDLQPFLFPLAPQRLCFRTSGTFLNTSCSLSLHNWNLTFRFKCLITHSDTHWKVHNRYWSLYRWQQYWMAKLHMLREGQHGKQGCLRKCSFQRKKWEDRLAALMINGWGEADVCTQTSDKDHFRVMCANCCGLDMVCQSITEQKQYNGVRQVGISRVEPRESVKPSAAPT